MIDAAERTFLLKLARAAVEMGAAGDPAPDPEALAAVEDFAIPGWMREHRGVFVTLERHGKLRGCIGYISGVRPLVEAVVENALAAAFKDPRFLPLDASELEGLELEISLLTPLRPVASPGEIEIPRHGVVLGKSGRRSVFLPQVAEEQGWDRDTMLSHLAMKAGLPPDAWREDADFQVFEAELLREDA